MPNKKKKILHRVRKEVSLIDADFYRDTCGKRLDMLSNFRADNLSSTMQCRNSSSSLAL